MRYVCFAVLLWLPSAAAFAQGTAEQREACTPDALRLCADAVPDIAKTTACMKVHVAELSPRCRAAFAAAEPAAPAPAQPTAAGPGAAPASKKSASKSARRDVGVSVRYPARSHRAPADPDAEVAYVPPRRVIAPPAYSDAGPVIFPKQPLPDGSFCSPPYDFCEPDPDDAW